VTAHKHYSTTRLLPIGKAIRWAALPCPAARRVTVVCLLPLDGRVVVFTSSSVFTSSLYQTSDENTDICPHGSRKTARSIESSVLPRGGNECMVDESCVPITHRQSGKRKQLLVPVPVGSRRRRQFVGAPIPIMSLHLHDVPRGRVVTYPHLPRPGACHGTTWHGPAAETDRAGPGCSRLVACWIRCAGAGPVPHRTARVAHPPPPPLCAVGADTDKAGTAWARGHTSPARRTGAIRAVRFFPKKKN